MHLKNLQKLRKERGKTQEGLAREAGISYHTLVKLENHGIRNPKIETVLRIAKALKVSLDDLVEAE